MRLCAAVAGVAIAIGIAGAGRAEPTGVVRVAQGDLTGVKGDGVEVFRGIPFAAPPVGDMRWRPPGPAPAWQGVKAADTFGAVCMQPSFGRFAAVKTSEDCLTLNIWRPAGAKAGAKLPVMVWIHGGYFLFGSGSTPFYDGTSFAKDGVVLVSLNYRLGRFGFFAHPALDVGPGPVGNYGLMDQIAALKWVRENIAGFGGDPDKVTVFGESAGAISVNYLMGSPAARGLFRGAIAESGFGRVKAFRLKGGRSAEQVGEAFAEKQGIKGEGPDAAAALRALPAEAVNFPPGDPSANPDTPSPLIDGQIVTQTIAEAFEKGDVAHAAYLEGGNSYEASLFPHVADQPNLELARYGDPAKIEAAWGQTDAAETAREVMTDAMMTEPDRFLARQMARHGGVVFVYHFSYVPEAQRAQSHGAGHGSEIGYVFGTLPKEAGTFFGRPVAAASPADWKVSQAMHAYWVSFAKTLDPGSAGGVEWPRYASGEDALVEFGTDGVQVRRGFEKARLDLLEKAAEAPPATTAARAGGGG